MPVTFEIFPDRGIVLIVYSGEARLDESFRAFAEYMAHPEASPDQKHLIDLSAVTSIEEDFPRLMALQAKKADGMSGTVKPAMLVYLAPTPMAQRMAQVIRRSWDGIETGPAIAIIEQEVEALAVLGIPERSITDLKRRVAED